MPRPPRVVPLCDVCIPRFAKPAAFQIQLQTREWIDVCRTHVSKLRTEARSVEKIEK